MQVSLYNSLFWFVLSLMATILAISLCFYICTDTVLKKLNMSEYLQEHIMTDTYLSASDIDFIQSQLQLKSQCPKVELPKCNVIALSLVS